MIEKLRSKIKSGKVVVGVWSILPNPVISEIIARSSFDFLIADMEHGPASFSDLESCIRATEGYQCSTLVRMPGLDFNSTQRALDLGASGVIYPQVRGAQDSQLVASFVQYPPKGVRGFNPFTRAWGYGLSASTTQKSSVETPWASVIVENTRAYQEIDGILEVEGLDMIYLGAYDMSVALGKPGDMENPELIDFIEKGIQKIRKAGKVAGIMGVQPEQTQRFVSMGANFIAVGVDTFLIGRAFGELKMSYDRLLGVR